MPRAIEGLTVADLLRGVALLAVVLGIGGLIGTEFLARRWLSKPTYHWLLFIGLFFLPILGLLGGWVTLSEETKKVESCNACHVMHLFVNDMKNPHSSTLSARHYRNRWIAKDQCYTCHTNYGVHGTLEAKRDGIRHLWLYTTRAWKEPIRLKGVYPNAICLRCHEGTPAFSQGKDHKALWEWLKRDEVACTACHGPAHPVPSDRGSPLLAESN